MQKSTAAKGATVVRATTAKAPRSQVITAGVAIQDDQKNASEKFSVQALLTSVGVGYHDLVKVIRAGVPAEMIEFVAHHVQIGIKDVAHALHINERTLSRRKGGLLNQEESEKVIRMAQVIEQAAVLFGDENKGITWIKQPNASLGGVPPLEMLDTGIGTEIVMDMLGRIEHGIYA